MCILSKAALQIIYWIFAFIFVAIYLNKVPYSFQNSFQAFLQMCI